jgi:hypothetical protein
MGAGHGHRHDQSTWVFETSACKPNAEGALSILAPHSPILPPMRGRWMCNKHGGIRVCVRVLVLSFVVSYGRGGGGMVA